MKMSRFAEERIVGVQREPETGAKTAEVCRLPGRHSKPRCLLQSHAATANDRGPQGPLAAQADGSETNFRVCRNVAPSRPPDGAKQGRPMYWSVNF